MDGEYDLDACTELQCEEREVLESIHPDYLSTGVSKDTIRLEVPVELSELTVVTVSKPRSKEIKSSTVPEAVDARGVVLKTLPPVLLDVRLPPTYPFTPPEIRTVHVTQSWLSFTSELYDHLLAKWENGEGVLYTWVEWIRSGEFLEELGMISNENGQRTLRLSHLDPNLLLPALEDYNSSAEAARFSQNSFECEVCLTTIKGARCIMLLCLHVFCRSCLDDFWGLCIREGDVSRVGCPDPSCVKAHNEATEQELRRVLTEEEVTRWKWLRMKEALEKDPTLVYCPLVTCHTPVPRPLDVEKDSPWERLRTCPSCDYSFCAYCKRTWHGPLTTCPISAMTDILEKYLGLPDDSPERAMMEARFGRGALEKLVREHDEELAFQEWLRQRTKMPCPGCDLLVEKHSGCNHMRCPRCRQHYCYRCGAKLDPEDPYEHFWIPGQRCFDRVFEYEE